MASEFAIGFDIMFDHNKLSVPVIKFAPLIFFTIPMGFGHNVCLIITNTLKVYIICLILSSVCL